MDIVLAVCLTEAGLAELWPQMLTFLGLGAVLFGLALAVFPRRLT